MAHELVPKDTESPAQPGETVNHQPGERLEHVRVPVELAHHGRRHLRQNVALQILAHVGRKQSRRLLESQSGRIDSRLEISVALWRGRAASSASQCMQGRQADALKAARVQPAFTEWVGPGRQSGRRRGSRIVRIGIGWRRRIHRLGFDLFGLVLHEAVPGKVLGGPVARHVRSPGESAAWLREASAAEAELITLPYREPVSSLARCSSS